MVEKDGKIRPVRYIGEISPENFSDDFLRRVSKQILDAAPRPREEGSRRTDASPNMKQNEQRASALPNSSLLVWYFNLRFSRQTMEFLIDNGIDLPVKIVDR